MDDWSLIGDPATVMVFTDSAKATSGFDLGFEKAMASDLDGWRPLFKSQSWTLWVHDSIDAIWALSVDEFAPIYSWVSSAYWWKDTISLLFWVSGMSPITSPLVKWTEQKEEGQELNPAERQWVRCHKRRMKSQAWQKMNDLSSMNESRCGQFLTSQMYVQACEGGWCGPECQKQPTYREQQELWPYQNQWRPWYR